MTPFESWYSSTVEPQLTKTVQHLPVLAAAALAKASKESMAACWNAALKAIEIEYLSNVVGGVAEVRLFEAQIKALRVKP
jgi:hypothetical protein